MVLFFFVCEFVFLWFWLESLFSVWVIFLVFFICCYFSYYYVVLYLYKSWFTLFYIFFESRLIAQDDGTDIEFRNVGFYTSDAGEIPKRT